MTWWAQDQGNTGTAGRNYFMKVQTKDGQLITLDIGDVPPNTRQPGSYVV